MTASLTVAQLDAAPKGSRLIYRRGRDHMIRYRTLVGWSKDEELGSVSSTRALHGLVAALAKSIRLLPPPAPVKVIGETSKLVSWGVLVWRMECQVAGCNFASTNFTDAAFVHEFARAHAKAHAEIGRAA